MAAGRVQRIHHCVGDFAPKSHSPQGKVQTRARLY